MPKRRRFAIAGLFVAAIATFFMPPVYWRVTGWVKGEAFYDGRPTRWWEREIASRYQPGRGSEGTYHNWEAAPPWFNAYLPESLRSDPWDLSKPPPLTSHDPRELDVLLELLHSDDAKVRFLAVWELGRLPFEPEYVLAALEEAAADPDADVQQEVTIVLPDVRRKMESWKSKPMD